MEGWGLTVLRVPNNAVNSNFRGVCEYIDEYVKTHMENESPSQLR